MAVSGAQASSDQAEPTSHTEMAQLICFVATYFRAMDADEEVSVCNDPFAEPLTRQTAPQLAPHVKKWKRDSPSSQTYLALMSRYLDETIVHRNPNIHQVVLLGSGLDARAFYLESLRDCHVFEIEQSPELFAHKQGVLNELGAPLIAKKHDCLVADLADCDWDKKLLLSGFDPTRPTLWVMENLLIYLPREVIVTMLKAIDALSAPGSETWGDIPGEAWLDESEIGFMTNLNKLSQAEVGHKLYLFGEDDPAEGVFSHLHWNLEVQTTFMETGIHFGRAWEPLRTTSSNKPVPFSFVHCTKPVLEP